DRRGRAKVRFSESVRGEEVFRDVIAGIRVNVSVGYRIHEIEIVKEGDPNSYSADETGRATDWEPLELSLVAVPADPTVGVNRSQGADFEPKEGVMDKDKKNTESVPGEGADKLALERVRSKEILDMGANHGLGVEARKAVEDGTDAGEFRKMVLVEVGKRTKSNKPLSKPDDIEIDPDDLTSEMGIPVKDLRKFSFVRALRALASPDNKKAQEAASLEREISDAGAKHYGKDVQGMFVPMDVLSFRDAPHRRDLLAGSNVAGGYTVAEDLATGSFIDLLSNKALLMQLGTVLPGLKGPVPIPKLTGGATAYWLGENDDTTESEQTFGQVVLRPHTCAALTEISRALLNQSSMSIDSLVKGDIARSVALEIDRVGFHGSGHSNEPLGILATTGIGDVAAGTNGLAPTWAHVVALETEVAADNADIGRLAYVTNSQVRGKMKTVTKDTANAPYLWDESNKLNGYDTYVTNQISHTLTKGNQSLSSAGIFGNWADLLIGLFSGIDLVIDPYTGSAAGRLRLVIFQDVDIAVRHAESFAACQDWLTA
ncbi:MAG: phage major capsid protein, partial [Gemmatimonadetes bacterium]|nr:phage major capsid protein [Gemmatimonadota bacterium]